VSATENRGVPGSSPGLAIGIGPVFTGVLQGLSSALRNSREC
jgi:hypothetical protein